MTPIVIRSRRRVAFATEKSRTCIRFRRWARFRPGSIANGYPLPFVADQRLECCKLTSFNPQQSQNREFAADSKAILLHSPRDLIMASPGVRASLPLNTGFGFTYG